MKALNRKVFWTLLGILTLILVVVLAVMNVTGYRREYENVKRNLFIMDKGGRDFENMMIMDYEIYVAELTPEGTILRTFAMGEPDDAFDAQSAAEAILAAYPSDTVHIENLYAGNYSFHYRNNNSIIIANDAVVAQKLWRVLLESLAIFVVIELLIVMLAKIMTGWITKPAREAFDRQKDFIADASHELKTPLAVIMASADELPEDATNRKLIANIKYESERMKKLIAELLDLSRLEDGITAAAYQDENLSGIVEKAALVFEAVAFEQGVAVETAITESIRLHCNREEIEKLVSILMDNAIRHSDRDSVIRLNLYRAKSSTILEIINCGEPIQQGEEQHIFERFYRADQARSRNENRYGLGLAIAKKIVQNHGGTIRAESDRTARTTTFRVEFK